MRFSFLIYLPQKKHIRIYPEYEVFHSIAEWTQLYRILEKAAKYHELIIHVVLRKLQRLRRLKGFYRVGVWCFYRSYKTTPSFAILRSIVGCVLRHSKRDL